MQVRAPHLDMRDVLSYSRFRLHATTSVDTDGSSIISYYEILKIYMYVYIRRTTF